MISGNILRPSGLWSGGVGSWIVFNNVNGLSIDSTGVIDCQGSAYWTCRNNHALTVLNANGSRLSGLKLINSPRDDCVAIGDGNLDVNVTQITCGPGHGIRGKSTTLQVSNVRYNNIAGTTTAVTAINLNCSQSVTCTDITLQNINIQSAAPGGTVVANCSNAQGTVVGVVTPTVPCLN
ncbi:hypothetical protein GW17_00008719 [Ensete ventricosum]|nr:hypothetical protein GW17_00008719 [Ensete ventricosum]